jgi:cytochrome c7-like protein
MFGTYWGYKSMENMGSSLHRYIRIIMSGAMAYVMLTMTGAAFAQMPNVEIPYLKEWASSPHAKKDAEAFVHWDHTENKMVPEACAKCHSTPGFLDFIGADGSTEWKVDKKAPLGSTVECVACHNDVTRFLTQVTFPSGVTVEDVGDEARCMTCHQGRASTVSIHKSTEGIGDDTISDKLKFINVHYRAAAATRYGTIAKGGYEYAGKAYEGLYAHDEGAETCMDCHNPHTTKISADNCSVCHREVREEKDFVNVRESKGDYDGDGDVKEGIAMEINFLHEALYSAIQSYAKDVAGSPIGYDAHNYPYFLNDSNGNGKIDEDEAKRANGYKSWTPRLLKAAYNYQFVAKDPGAYTHNPRYIIQLLHDSLADLGSKTTVAMDGFARP